MSAVYVVVATRDSEIETCEAFSGAQAALGRAFQLASDKSGRGRIDLFNPSPEEEKLLDGNIRWVFMETNIQSVVVYYRSIEESLRSVKDSVVSVSKDESSENRKSFSSTYMPPSYSSTYMGGGSGAYGPPAIKKVFDYTNLVLPFSWMKHGKPCLMSEAKMDPVAVINPCDLTNIQKWALVTARVKKSSDFELTSADFNIEITGQTMAIGELLSKSAIGTRLVEAEITRLGALHDLFLNPNFSARTVSMATGSVGTVNTPPSSIVGVTGPVGPTTPKVYGVTGAGPWINYWKRD